MRFVSGVLGIFQASCTVNRGNSASPDYSSMPGFLQVFLFAWCLFSAQSTRTIMLEIVVACLLLLLKLLEYRFGFGAHALGNCRRARYEASQRYRGALNSVQCQSRLATTALPHVIFVALAALIECAVSPQIAPSARAPLLLFVACARPAMRSVTLLHALGAEERVRRCSAEVDALQLWVVTALILVVRALVHFLCPLMLANVLIRADVVMFYFCVWLQASCTCGFAIAYRALAVVTGNSSIRQEANGIGDTKRAQLGMAFGLLGSFGMVTQETADALANTLAESGVTLVGAVFLITPPVVTFAGTVVVGSLAPTYLTASALQAQSSAADRRRNWLTYCAVYGVGDAVIGVLAPVLQ